MIIRANNDEIWNLKVGDRIYYTTSEFEYNGITGVFENNLENWANVEIDKNSIIADESELVVGKCTNGGCYGFYDAIVTDIIEIGYEQKPFQVTNDEMNITVYGTGHYWNDEEYLEFDSIKDADGVIYNCNDIQANTKTDLLFRLIKKEIDAELDEVLQFIYDECDFELKHGIITKDKGVI